MSAERSMSFAPAGVSFEQRYRPGRLPEMKPYRCPSENVVPTGSTFRIPFFRRTMPPSPSRDIGEGRQPLPGSRPLGSAQIAFANHPCVLTITLAFSQSASIGLDANLCRNLGQPIADTLRLLHRGRFGISHHEEA